LLIVSADEPDPDFAKTAILMIQHSRQQAVGVVLNRPSGQTVEELWKSEVKKPCDRRGPVYSGGPVPGPLMALHTCGELSEIEVLEGVHYSVRKQNLQKLVRRTDGRLKVFDSHAGWGPGQLEEQLRLGTWLSTPTSVDQVFDEGPDLWEKFARQV